MDIYTTEEQQVEAIKRWWQENAIAVALGIVLSLGAVLGWRYWQGVQQDQAEAASHIYQTIIAAMRGREYDAARQAAQGILADYPGSSYAVFSRLMLARIAVAENKLDEAGAQLKAALAHNKDQALAHLLRIRLARVLLSQQETEAAAKLLDVKDRGSFAASYAELKGDVKMMQGDLIAARLAYRDALQEARENERDSAAIEIKLNNIGR